MKEKKKKRNDTGNRLGQPDGSGSYRIPYKYPTTRPHTVSFLVLHIRETKCNFSAAVFSKRNII